jgi:hypothetical protein
MGYPIGYDVCTWLCSNVLTNIAKRKRRLNYFINH